MFHTYRLMAKTTDGEKLIHAELLEKALLEHLIERTDTAEMFDKRYNMGYESAIMLIMDIINSEPGEEIFLGKVLKRGEKYEEGYNFFNNSPFAYITLFL